MYKKLTYEYVKNQIEKEKYYLISTNYINNHTKLKIKCPKNHEFWMRWGNFKNGNRCPICKFESKKLTYEYVKEYIESFNYKLISNNYKSFNSKLKIECDKKHVYEVTWNYFKKGHRCSVCFFESKKLTYNYIKEYVKSINYKLEDVEYISCKTKLKLRCPKGHKFDMSWSSIQQGHRCPICYRYNNNGSIPPNWENYTIEELNKLDIYRKCVLSLSNKNYRKYKKIINPNNLERSINKYHLDHIFSIIEGFRRDIPVKYIANPYNLQMLYSKKNIIKKDTCWQSEKKLYQGYAKFKKEKEKK